MYQLIKDIKREPRNKEEGFVYFFDSSLKEKKLNFTKLFESGENNKILRFNRNFKIFESTLHNSRKKGVKFFGSYNEKKEVEELIISTASSTISSKKNINLEETIKDLIRYNILNYKISKNEELNIMNIFVTENVNENCNILDLFKIKLFSLDMIGIKNRQSVSNENFLLLAKKVGNKTIISKFLNSLISLELGVAELSLTHKNLEKYLNNCEFKHELESTEFYNDNKLGPNFYINIETGILYVKTLGDMFKIKIKPGVYKMFELYDKGFKNNKENQLKLIEADKNYKYFIKKYPNLEDDDYELAMAYKEGYDPNEIIPSIGTPNNHFLLLLPK